MVVTIFSTHKIWSSPTFWPARFGRHDFFSHVATTFSCGLFWSSWSSRPFLAGCFGLHDFFSHVATTFSCGLFWLHVATTCSCRLFWSPWSFLVGCFGRHDFFNPLADEQISQVVSADALIRNARTFATVKIDSPAFFCFLTTLSKIYQFKVCIKQTVTHIHRGVFPHNAQISNAIIVTPSSPLPSCVTKQ